MDECAAKIALLDLIHCILNIQVSVVSIPRPISDGPKMQGFSGVVSLHFSKKLAR